MNGAYRLNGDVVSEWNPKLKRFERIFEFDGYLTKERKEAIVRTLNGEED